MDQHESQWTTSVSQVADDDVIIRGYAISDLIRQCTFSEVYYLITFGELPSPGETRLMDAVLCSVLDYGLQKPGTVVARTVVSTNPSTMSGIASAMLAGGEHTMDPAPAARFVHEAVSAQAEAGGDIDEFARKRVAEARAERLRIPGLGHPVYRYVDPRSKALRAVAQEAGLLGSHLAMLEAIHRALIEDTKFSHFPINDVGMVAVLLADLGFRPHHMAGIMAASSIPGLVAHIDEEIEGGQLLRGVPRTPGQYQGTPRRELPPRNGSR